MARRRSILLAASLLGLGAALALQDVVQTPAAAPSARHAATLDRSTVDRTDDIVGPQVHVLYVVAADGEDRQLDVNGTIRDAVARIEVWLANQTGGASLRFDTYQGGYDVTFVRLPHPDAQIAMNTPTPLNVMGEDLAAAGFDRPQKYYAAFYDGHSNWSCGAALSPALPRLGAMFLRAWPTNDARPCSDAPGFGSGLDRPGYFEIGLLHEILHTHGFAPPCAPHLTARDHVNDSPTDLLYHPDASSPAGWDWPHAVLDYNHDDYYGERVPPGCPNLRDSPLLTTARFARLTVSVEGKGEVRAPELGVCTAEAACNPAVVPVGTEVTLRAAPAPGWHLAAWRGVDCAVAPDCTVTVGTDREATAVFAPDPLYTLAVKWDRGGAVRATPGRTYRRSFRQTLRKGTRVVLRALPSRGFRFARWSGACRETSPACRVTVDANKTVRVTFRRRPS